MRTKNNTPNVFTDPKKEYYWWNNKVDSSLRLMTDEPMDAYFTQIYFKKLRKDWNRTSIWLTAYKM
jgi:hypothetical protein